MKPDPDQPETDSEVTVNQEDFDFDFDEDFEAENRAEYNVMDAMSFDRDAGTASCNFDLDEEVDDSELDPEAVQTREREEAVNMRKNGQVKKK